MPFTQLSRDTRISIIKRTTARGAWESERPWSLHCGHVNWSTYIDIKHRIEKANKVLFCLRRNVSFNVKFSVKLGLHKSVIPPVLLYGMNCAYQSRTDQRKLKNFQRRVLKLVCGPHRGYYKAQLRLLNVLPLPLIQLNDLLSKLYKDIEEHKINLPIQSWNNRACDAEVK